MKRHFLFAIGVFLALTALPLPAFTLMEFPEIDSQESQGIFLMWWLWQMAAGFFCMGVALDKEWKFK